MQHGPATRTSATLAYIIQRVQRDLPSVGPLSITNHVPAACEQLLAQPNSPGDWFGEQIALLVIAHLRSCRADAV
jgi:hypothetical protein